MKLTKAQQNLLDRIKSNGGAMRFVDLSGPDSRVAHRLHELGLLERDGEITSNIYGGSTMNHYTWVVPE